MTIYILNILNDSMNAKKNLDRLKNYSKCIIQDSKYISSFSYFNKNASIAQLNKGLLNIYEIMKKYCVQSVGALEILEVIFGNEYNDWILNKIYKSEHENNEEKLILPHIVNDIIENDTEKVLCNLSNMSDNVKKIILKTMFIPLNESKYEIEKYMMSQAS